MKQIKWVIACLVLVLVMCSSVESAYAVYAKNYTVQYYHRNHRGSSGQTTNYLFSPPATFSPTMTILHDTTSIGVQYSTNSAVLTRQKGGTYYWFNKSWEDIQDSTFEYILRGRDFSAAGWYLFKGPGDNPTDLIGVGSSNTIDYETKTITFGNANFSGLTPNSVYSLGTDIKGWSLGVTPPGQMDIVGTDDELDSYNYFLLKAVPNDFSFFEVAGSEYKTFSVYTEAVVPILSASNIKDTKTTLNWSATGNPSNTVYVLQRKLGGGAWQTLYTGSLMTFTDTNLICETTYQYRVIAKHIADSNRDKICYQNDQYYIDVTTTADPAVAAAQEAALKAAAAEQAAKETLQYSLDAKNAAIDAKDKASDVYNLVAGYPPEINRIYTTNAATATIGSLSPPILIESDTATHYQLSLDRINWSEPIPISSEGYITLNSGLNNVFVRVWNENISEDLRSYGTGSIMLFRL